MILTTGTKLGPYEILAPIGSGGMGEVWKARDTRLGRIVAIKKVKEQHSERFKQEARTIAALNHPYICQLFDVGPDYLVLEYVEGKSLSSPLPESEAVRLAIQIAAALEEAHQKGVIHRDLKPSNIMVSDKGSVKLLDFGLAKLYEQDASIFGSPTADFPATQAGAVLGTVGLHVARAGSRPTSGCAIRHFLLRVGAVRNAERPEGILGRQQLRDNECHREGRTSSSANILLA